MYNTYIGTKRNVICFFNICELIAEQVPEVTIPDIATVAGDKIELTEVTVPSKEVRITLLKCY